MNAGSLLFGLAAWVVPAVALIRRRPAGAWSAVSAGTCAAALYLQILYGYHLVTAGDWAAVEDTAWAVVLSASALLAGTLLLNGMLWCRGKGR